MTARSSRRQTSLLACVLTWIVFSAIAPGALRAAETKPARPNILFIFADDQSTKTVGCYERSWPWVKTPNIDRLAKNGVRFTHCYLGSWCMPSRATLLTGRHPHGIESMRMEGEYPGSAYDPAACRFWPSVLRQHGYHTAQIGKWHTGVDAGYRRDWDYQIVWNRPKHPDNAGAYYTTQIVDWNGIERRVEGYSTDNYTDWACDYIRGAGRDPAKPWYLWLCYGAVHGPNTPAKRHLGTFANAPVPQPADIFPPRPGKPAYLDKTQSWLRGPDGLAVAGKSGEKFGDESGKQNKTFAHFVRQVNECALAVDEGVGRVMAALAESGQLDNTLVIYSADQGFSMGEHGFRTKLGPYDANYNSPLIIARPGSLPEGETCRVPVNGCDLVQTFLAQAGVPEPWKMHGHDLSAVLKNPTQTVDRPLLYEHMGHYYGSDTDTVPTDAALYHNNVPRWFALREGALKYIRTFVAGEMEEIYDLAADPEELENLALRPDMQSKLADLRAKALAELRRTEARFVDQLPPTRQMLSAAK